MRTYFDCIPCIIRQTLDAIRLINDDKKIHEQILREVLCLASDGFEREPSCNGTKNTPCCQATGGNR